MNDDLRHDRAVLGILILVVVLVLVGVEGGIWYTKSLAERPGIGDGGSVSEAMPRGSPAGPLSQAEGDPIWQQSAEQALLRDQMLLSCDPVEVAAEISRADAYREAAVGVNAGGSLSQRQLYALGAVASELWLGRCLRWFGAR